MLDFGGVHILHTRIVSYLLSSAILQEKIRFSSDSYCVLAQYRFCIRAVECFFQKSSDTVLVSIELIFFLYSSLCSQKGAKKGQRGKKLTLLVAFQGQKINSFGCISGAKK